MNNEELIKENLLLREENEKLKKQLENYNKIYIILILLYKFVKIVKFVKFVKFVKI